MPTDALTLLRTFEPVVRFTRGEYFFPVSVQRYVERASLWSDGVGPDEIGQEPTELASPGSLDLTSLGTVSVQSQGLGTALSGIGIGAPTAREVVVPRADRPPRLRGTSRLAAVGLTGRLVDSLNRVSLLFRGSVPGGSAGRSFLLQRDWLAPEAPTYYGRVLRDGHWLVCQYWYFYSFNNWRSGFGGVNEHEADWEQVTIYLDATDPGSPPEPRWVVFSAHDETGDDLRRRWDDPDLEVVDGRHPVVFAGAGSHSGSYLPGDYLITVEPPKLGGVVAVIRWLARVLVPWSVEAQSGLGIPYVDYARGDGRAVGPAQPEDWTAEVIDEETAWVRDFRGLWGHDTRDRLGGERGPAGPRSERDGSVRASWADPVGWAGLAKVAPNRAVEQDLLEARREAIELRLKTLTDSVATERARLAAASAGHPPAAPEVRALAERERELLAQQAERTRLDDERRRICAPVENSALTAPPHAHLRHRRTPLEPVTGVRARMLSWWAVLSTPLILWAVGAIVFPIGLIGASVGALGWVLLLFTVEGILRGRVLAVLARVALFLIALAGLVLLWQDWRYVVGAAFLVAATVSLVVNLREALRR